MSSGTDSRQGVLFSPMASVIVGFVLVATAANAASIGGTPAGAGGVMRRQEGLASRVVSARGHILLDADAPAAFLETEDHNAIQTKQNHKGNGPDDESGAADEGGSGGEAPAEVGPTEVKALSVPAPAPSSTNSDSSASGATSTGSTEHTDVNSVTTSGATQDTKSNNVTGPAPVKFGFMLKSVSKGLCLELQTDKASPHEDFFLLTNCNEQEKSQKFTAHGMEDIKADVMATKVTMHNGKVLCFSGSDLAVAYDDSCVPEFAGIELEPTANKKCFKVKWNPGTGPDAQIKTEKCMGLPHEQDMLATNDLCSGERASDALWSSDPNVTSCGD